MDAYKNFCTAEGNQHIASEYAVVKLQSLLERFSVNSVLEIGLGIGAIAGSLLSANENLKYTGTEDNDFCLNALSLNLANDYERLKVFPRLEEVPLDEKYDLLIVDGKDPKIDFIKQLISRNGIIVIEGDRSPQQDLLLNIFPNYKFVHSISKVKNKEYSPFSPESWQGGVKVIFVQPTLAQFFWWAKEKIRTKIKYQLR